MDISNKNKEIMVRIICVILAFALWLYVNNIENPTRTFKLSGIPVEIINQDALKDLKLTLLPNQEYTVTLNLEGPTSEVFSAKPSQFRVVADLSAYAVTKGEVLIPVEIVSFPSNINIKNDKFLRVKVYIDDYVEKSVPILPEVKVSTKQGAYTSEPDVKPTNGMVSGPAQYVNNVKYLIAKGEVNNADKDVSVNLPLKAVDADKKEVQHVKIEPSNAMITIPVRKSKFVNINVKTKGILPNGLTLKNIDVTPDKLEVIGDESVLNNISSLDTEPIDLSKIPENGEVEAKIVITEKIKIIGNKNTVLVNIKTAKLAQKSFNIKLSAVGLGEGFSGQLERDTITVVAEAEEKAIASIKEEDFKAEVNASGLTEGVHDIPIKVTSGKQEVRIVNFNPEKVKYTITKK
ncbi:CdaR family protein [Clostridium polynesiense]|uniref:CdaR family protein n=1 Tax=Clostridium polynesiense TaxID=1325933 RepID=UPI00058D69D9|nr:CdaR family protein [Clostridium polynesiense]